MLSSLVNQVLQDDQVFAILGGEARRPRRHSPLLDNPMQETMDCSMKIDEYNSLYGGILTRGMLIYIKRTIKRDIISLKMNLAPKALSLTLGGAGKSEGKGPGTRLV